MARTFGQERARASNIAKGRRRKAQAIALSEAGVGKSEAAARIGLTAQGLNTLLYREFSSQVWPIAGHAPAASTSEVAA